MKNSILYSICLSLSLFLLGSSTLGFAQNYEPVFEGQWTVVGVSAFAPPDQLPQYEAGDFIWDFGSESSRDYGNLQVSKTNDQLKTDNYTYSEGEHQFWIRQCLIQVGNTTYHYQFDGPNGTLGVTPPPSADGKPAPLHVYLNTSLDPSIADGGYTLILRKMSNN